MSDLITANRKAQELGYSRFVIRRHKRKLGYYVANKVTPCGKTYQAFNQANVYYDSTELGVAVHEYFAENSISPLH